MNPRKNSNKTNAIFLILGGLIGVNIGNTQWTASGESYTRLTELLGYGYLLLYVTGNNQQSLFLIADSMRVYKIKSGHGNNIGFYKKNRSLFVKTAFSMNLFICASSFPLSIEKNQLADGLENIPIIE